jgi:hypothetical protein
MIPAEDLEVRWLVVRSISVDVVDRKEIASFFTTIDTPTLRQLSSDRRLPDAYLTSTVVLGPDLLNPSVKFGGLVFAFFRTQVDARLVVTDFAPGK